METIGRSLREALRRLARRPWMAGIAVLSLSLGIGVTTLVFTLVDGLLLRALPVREPAALVSIFTEDTAQPGLLGVSYPNFVDLRQGQHTLAQLAIYQWTAITLSDASENEQLFGQIVSGNYFDTLGVPAALGRTFTPDEDRNPGEKAVVVLSHDLWSRRFGRDRGILGRSILLNGLPYQVVGVAPPGFRGLEMARSAALWVPSMMYAQAFPYPYNYWFRARRAVLFNVVGRLLPQVPLEAAKADLQTLGARLARDHPAENRGRSLRVEAFSRTGVRAEARSPLLRAGVFVSLVAALVLAIAISNLTSLLLAGVLARGRELATRVALGASLRTLGWQAWSESLLLGLTSGVGGSLLAAGGLALMRAIEPPSQIPLRLQATLGLRAWLVAGAVSLLAGGVVGLVVARRAALLGGELARGPAPVGGGLSGRRLQQLLVVIQLSLCFVALASSGAVLRSLQLARRIDPGFRVPGVSLISFDLSSRGYGEAETNQVYERLLDRAERLPGAAEAALAEALPLAGGGLLRSVIPEGRDDLAEGGGVLVPASAVSADYLGVLGIALLRGRFFEPSDRVDAPAVVVVNRAFAERFWPGVDPIGKRLRFFGSAEWSTVVGEVADTKVERLDELARPSLIYPLAQNYTPRVTLFVRGDQGRTPRPQVLRDLVHELEPTVAVVDAMTLEDLVERSLWAPRALAALLSGFAALALVLALMGVFGLMSQMAEDRRRELAVRLALGAARESILISVLLRGLRLAGAGVALGCLLFLLAVPWLDGLLYGVRATHPGPLLLAASGLVLVTLVAVLLPARRASRTEPMSVLRVD